MQNACQSFCMHRIWGEKRWLFVIALRDGVSVAAGGALIVVQLQQASLGGPGGYDAEYYGQIVVEVSND